MDQMNAGGNAGSVENAGLVGEMERRLPELRPRLHRYCARMAGSAVDGEDILQEALVKAFAALGGGTVVDDIERWLFRIAHNAAQDHLRRRARQNAMIGEADMTAIEDPTASAEQRLAVAASLRTFMHLPVAQRSAVILVDVLGFSLKETCEVMDATLAAAKAALHRGRTRLTSLATQPDDIPAPTLSHGEELRLRRYIDRFNARDFDAIRTMIAEDVQLDLVAVTRMRGKREVSSYFGNYASLGNWTLSFGFVDGRPAILMRKPGSDDPPFTGFMLLEWDGDTVAVIRDFRHAAYVLDDADIVTGDFRA